MTYRNLEKLAADTGVLRRFARRHIWNAPHRGFGENAEEAIAALPGLRRDLREAERALARWASSPDGAQRELEARAERHRERMKQWEQERQAALDAFQSGDEFQHRRQRINDQYERDRARAQKFLDRGDDPTEVAEWLAEQRQNLETSYGALRDFREAPVLNTSPPRNPHLDRATSLKSRLDDYRQLAAGIGRGSAASHSPPSHIVNLHGPEDGPGTRLLHALHENNERDGSLRTERAVGRTWASTPGEMPRRALSVLPMSSHVLPSVPLRDVNIANTAWGDDAENLQARVHELRFTPRVRGNTEIEEIGQMVPGAQRILENSRILPGAPVPATPGYVQHAQQRLIGAGAEAPPSPAVRQRLQRIIDRHAAGIAPPSHPRLNRNELRMIDDSFHRTYNPEFPQLVARRVPSPQAPATPLPAEQRSAFREALAAQPGLTRKQFLAQQR